MDEQISFFLMMLIFLEIFELLWQKGATFQEYLKNLFYFYNKGAMFFILLHPTFYFSLFCQMLFDNYSVLATLLTLIKFFDITFKISLMDKLYKNKDLGFFKEAVQENLPLPKYLKSSGLILYPILFFFAYTKFFSWQKKCFIIKFQMKITTDCYKSNASAT